MHPDDGVAGPPAGLLAPRLRGADLVLAPRALGGHADHRVVADVVAALAGDAWWWRDAPCHWRRPDAVPRTAVPDGREHAVDVTAHLAEKTAAARYHTTQLGFQFGGASAVGPALAAAGPELFRVPRVGAPEGGAVATCP